LNNITTDKLIRTSKATLMLFFCIFGLLMMHSNFTDYTANHEYVSHILSMDTIDDAGRYSHRAITSPMLHHRIYWIIMTLEVTYTVFCLIGAWSLFRNINSSRQAFHEAKKYSIIGLLIAIFVYYVCLQVIGVEWFNMDLSEKWNYKDWARHIVDFIFALLIYVTMRIER
jgi:predicted small integral membrane protein